MFRRSLAAAVASGVAVLGAPLLPGPAQAATGSSPTVVDVPANVRYQPRDTHIVGQTASQGLLIRQETDPVTGDTGDLRDLLVATDGSAAPAGVQGQDVLGDRVVTAVGWDSVTSVVLPDPGPTTLAVPGGYRLLDYTGDGLLLSSTASGPQSLALLPWSGGDPVPVAGALGDVTFGTLSPGVHDLSGALVRAYPVSGAPGFEVFVSTSARRSWSLANPDGPCDGATGATWALGDGTIAWQTTGAEARQICTEPQPTADTDVPGPALARTAVDLPVTNQWYDVALLPVGDEVVVSRRAVSPQTDAPVFRVAADGTATRLLAWGHDVEPAGTDAFVAVGGPSPADLGLDHVEVSTGTVQVLIPIAPVPATTTSLAVDDGRVVVMDNSAAGSAVVQRPLTFADLPHAGEPQTLDTQVTDQVAAGDGETAWEKYGAWTVRDAAGTTTSQKPGNGWLPTRTRAVSGKWVLYDRGSVLDREQNSLADPEPATYSGDRDLVDGVLYLRGAAVSSALQDRVIMRDLATGQAASLHVPGCASAGNVQAAGPWLMAWCSLAQGGYGYVVVDRTGATATSTLPDTSVVLGDGFAVRRGSDSSLDWRPLADPAAQWQPLAPAGAATLVAVGKGSEPDVAWSDGHTTRVARLPVTVGPGLPRPTGVTPPSAPQVSLTPFNRSIAVHWAPAPTDEQLTGYQVALGSGYPSYLGIDATSKTFTSLINGSTYKVTVTAVNIAGRTSTTLGAVPLAPAAAPTNVQATVDPVTSRVQVTWDWSATPTSEALTGFDVGAGGLVGAAGLAPDARSASFVMPQAWTGPVTVTSRGSAQTADGNSAALTFPGPDTTAPSSSLGGVRDVTQTSSVALSVGGTDDRALAGIDVRWRSAAFGQRLGAWTQPSGWHGRNPGPLTVTGLRVGGTYCFSSRAHDVAGNVSAWTPARCTSVVLDDRSLDRSGRWTSVSGSVYYRSTASRSTTRYATLSRTSVHAASVWLVATTCPTCGSVTVFSGNTSFGAVSLRSATLRPRALVKMPWPMRTGGTLKIVTWPRWGAVTIDGVAVRSY
ncbi:MAG: fibronectin type III domain-containing protein [Nocardioidaceae bacterium]